MTTLEQIKDLAARESELLSARGRADAAWRRAWWELTLALGRLPKSGSGAQVRVAAEIVGQSIETINRRRQLGARIFVLADENIYDLPPRMMLAIPAAQFAPELIEMARQAERDGVSLREFTQELTGKGWADTAEGMSEEAISNLVEKQPERVAKVVARSVASGKLPSTKIETAVKEKKAAVIKEAHDKLVNDYGVSLKPQPATDVPSQPHPIKQQAITLRTYTNVESIKQELAEIVEDVMVNQNLFGAMDRAYITEFVDDTRSLLDMLSSALNGKVTDADLASLLDGMAE